MSKMCARRLEGMAAPGDRILIVKPCWLQLILSGAKTMEIRGTAYRPGKYWLGHQRQILAVAQLGKPLRVSTPEQWISLQPQHRVMRSDLPYKNTFALPIESVRPVSPFPFRHPRGAINIVRYRP